MKKNILLYGAIGVVVVIIAVVSVKKINSPSSQNTRQGELQEAPVLITDGNEELSNLADKLAEINNVPSVALCADICLNAKAACLAVSDNCVNLCDNWSDQERQLAKEGRSCSDFENIANLVDQDSLKQKEAVASTSESDCQFSCINYVNKCLTLVPGANQALFNDGLLSCLGECADWNDQKINCIMNAPSCESITDVCGL